jgi:hypothetical protein
MSSQAQRLSYETKALTALFVERLQRLRNNRHACSLAIRPEQHVHTKLNGEVAVGVDGSMDYDEHLELQLFYVVAAAYRCGFKADGGQVAFDLKHAVRDDSLRFSAAVPLWTEDASALAPELAGLGDQEQVSGARRIPYALMTMAELALGLRALEDKSVGILFLDRPLSGTYLPLARDLRLLLRAGGSVLVGQPTAHGPLGWVDLVLASGLGPPGAYVPPRRPYTPYALISCLVDAKRMGESLTTQELGGRLGLDHDSTLRALRAVGSLEKRLGHPILVGEAAERWALADGLDKYWDRVLHVSLSVVRRVFEASERHPLHYGGEKWLGVLELNAVNCFLVLELAARALRRGALLIGVTKDSRATDYIRAVLPHLASRGVVGAVGGDAGFKSDTSFLTVMSAVNSDTVPTPWRTHAYDACFASLVGDPGGALRASRRRVSRERLFVKAYFQLRSYTADPAVRSPVFSYERPFDATVDASSASDTPAADIQGDVTIRPFAETSGRSALDDLVLCVLAACDNPEVMEAYGHNQLLYLADKYVKAEVKLMRHTLRGIAAHELTALERREKIFMVSRRFRELRSQLEAERDSRWREAEFGEQSA